MSDQGNTAFFSDPTPPRTFLRPRPPALPKSYEEMVAGKLIKAGKTLNDHVDDLHNLLWAEGADHDPSYVQLIDAVYDEDAVEGSTIFDDYLLAKMIIDKAEKMGNTYVSHKKPATIAKAHRTVLRRYGLNRKQRRDMVAGEVVGGNGNRNVGDE